MTKDTLVSIQDLSVAFTQGGRETLAVDRISFDINKGETVALVGESGSGKSVSALSVLKLLPYPAASHPTGKIVKDGVDLLQANANEMRKVRGNEISVIFQEPMTSLNPFMKIGTQLMEALRVHNKTITRKAARERILDLLNRVGIREAERSLKQYPHEFSGGQLQRIVRGEQPATFHYRNKGEMATIGRASAGRGLLDGPGISIKLSALHPRFEAISRARAIAPGCSKRAACRCGQSPPRGSAR